MPAMRLGFGGAPEANATLEIDPQPQTVHAGVIIRATITEPTALG
jgi:hypothetical protein